MFALEWKWAKKFLYHSLVSVWPNELLTIPYFWGERNDFLCKFKNKCRRKLIWSKTSSDNNDSLLTTFYLHIHVANSLKCWRCEQTKWPIIETINTSHRIIWSEGFVRDERQRKNLQTHESNSYRENRKHP